VAIVRTKFEGMTDISVNVTRCVCGFCGHHDNENAIIEFNFKEQSVFYKCGSHECGKMNKMQFGKEPPKPLPRIGVGR